ncbi:MAG TPA: hypothetical protein VD947_00170, partial [Patescibacteria group bacterium]|nr:hypothetical protein [Patescibacteria group bacterium]
MDFTNRTSRPQQTGDGPANSDSSLSGVKNTKPGRQGVFGKFRQHALLNISYLALLLSITVVIVGVVLALFFFEGNREDKLIDSSKHQAVFLDNGQVYFGNITDLNKGFLTLSNIYYLRVNQQVQPGKQAGQNDVSLVKLGCELHGPQDTMVINKEQITFWENLKDDGQVAGAIAEYVKANPNGQDCSQQQQQQSSGTSESTNSGGTSTGTNSTNTTDNTDSSDTSTDAGTDDQNSAPT